MKQTSDTPTPAFTDLRSGKFLFAYNRETVTVEGEEKYQFDAIEVDKPDRDVVIAALLAQRYSLADEIALINNKLSSAPGCDEEYGAYLQFRAETKSIVDTSIAQG